MQVADKRMIASVGLRICGSGRSSTRTSPGAYMTAPRTIVSSISLWSGWLSRNDGLLRIRTGPHRGTGSYTHHQQSHTRAGEEVSIQTCPDRASHAAGGHEDSA